jgi:8-oxo-dGTP pyrophosphatase MutT (NUDIX family)
MASTRFRRIIADLAVDVSPLDDEEAETQKAILQWVASGAPLFRTHPPDIPPMHLAVYLALLDEKQEAVLLVDHIKADLWLLPGGHVDPDEDPRHTPLREAKEELGVTIEFHAGVGDRPVFLTVTATRGLHPHTDVTFWFVAQGDRTTPLAGDPGEFRSVAWFDLAATDWADGRFDPQMARFACKLRRTLDGRPGETPSWSGAS